MKRQRLLLAWLLAMMLTPRWGFAQDDFFSGRTADYITPDIQSNSWSTSWQTKSGSISAGHYHRYDCYLTSGNIYYFNVCSELGGGGTADFDTYMALRDGWGDYSSGVTWLASDDDGCSNSHSKITYTATSSGWTSLFITAYGNNTSGTYTLAYKYVAAPQPPTPITMTCGQTYSGTLGTLGVWQNYTNCSWDELGAEKSYAYTPPVTGSYTFTATEVSGDPDFFLMSSNGNTGTNINSSCWDYGNKTVTLTGGQTYYLIIDNADETEDAQYEVSVACPITPPTVTSNGYVTGTLTNTSATLSCSITDLGGASSVTAGICISTSNTPTTSDTHLESGYTSTGSYTKEVTGLQPGTRYYWRAYAYNSANSQSSPSYGDIYTFMTLGPAPVPYTCNFESSSENLNWTLTEGTTDSWVLGTDAYSSSSHALYISHDGTTNTYGGANHHIYAYRELNVQSADAYVVSFKWRCAGESSNDYLRAFLVPTSINPTLTAGTTNSISTSGAPSNWIAVDGSTKLNGEGTSWTTVTNTVTLSAVNYYLVFYWTTDGSWQGDDGSHSNQNPPAAVDDISITVAPKYTLTFNSSPSGSGTVTVTNDGNNVSSGTSWAAGKTLDIKATANHGYVFNNWTVSGTNASVADASSNSTTLTMGSSATTLTANFVACPSNSYCSTATDLPCGTSGLAGTTVNTPGDPHGLPDADVSNYGVWYTFLGTGGSTTITSVATFDHEMDIVKGSCGDFTKVYYKDDTSGSTETYSFTTEVGMTYYVYIAHYSSSSTTTGTFTISRTCDAVTTPPMTTMTCGYTYQGTCGNSYNTWTNYPGVSWNEPGEEHIYAYTPPVTGNYTFQCGGVSGDCDFFLMTSLDDSSWESKGHVSSGSLSASLTGGTTYYLIVDNYKTTASSYTVSVDCPRFNIITNSEPSAGGSISGASGTYAEGETCELTATPANGYYFTGWTVEGSGSTLSSTTANPTTFTMGLGDATVTANFTEWSVNVATTPSSTECLTSGAQVSMVASTDAPNAYSFTATSSTFSSISGSPDGSTTTTGDGTTMNVSLPFNFNLAGKDFAAGTTLYMRCDGFVAFGSSWSSNSPSGPGTTHDVISAFGYDQELISTSAMYYKVTGTEGSRVLTMEWKNMRSYYSSYNYANYQVKMYEGSNAVELCYGDYTHGSTRTVYIYVSANGKLTQLLSITEPAVTTNEAGTTTGISVSSAAAAPASGTVYRFSPSLSYVWTYTGTAGIANYNNYTVTPTENSTYTVSVSYNGYTKTSEPVEVTIIPTVPTNLQVNNVTTTGASVTWTANGASSWQYSYDGSTWNTTSSPTANLSGLTGGSSYTFYVKAVNGSCESDTESIQINTNSTLITSVNPDGIGSITCNPSATGGVYGYGTPVQLTAPTITGYTFMDWSVDGESAGSNNPYTITMNGDHNVVANYGYTIHAIASPVESNISVSINGGTAGTDITETVAPDSDVTITASCSNSDYYGLAFWEISYTSGGNTINWTSTDNPYTINDIDENYTITAYFAPKNINSVARWNAFCNAVNGVYSEWYNVQVGGYDYYQKTVYLTDHVSTVTTMAGVTDGEENNPDVYQAFRGTFEGNGYALTVSLDSDDADEQNFYYCAPFRKVYGATIQNLQVYGGISTVKQGAGGIVGLSCGVLFINCKSAVAITNNYTGNDATSGGFVAVARLGITNFIGCAFTGALSSTSLLPNVVDKWGGFVGWRDNGNSAAVNIINSIFDPLEINHISTTNSATFCRNGANITNSYYSQSLGAIQIISQQGKQYYKVVSGQADVSVAINGTETHYDVSKIKYFSGSDGLQYYITESGSGNYYNIAGHGDEVNLILNYSSTIPDGKYVKYRASDASSTQYSELNPSTGDGTDDETTLYMLDFQTFITAELMNTNYTITVEANPTAGGTVSGGGNNYHYNDPCAVTATANPGYSFVNWTEGASVVSTDASYSFSVTGDRTLVANFNMQPTWVTQVTTQPAGYSVSGTEVTISSEEGLAWLISHVNGLNLQTPYTLADTTITLTRDLDMSEYIWVPIGTATHPFSGTFNGNNHVIKGLHIRNADEAVAAGTPLNTGLFGYTVGGAIKNVSVTAEFASSKSGTTPIPCLGILAAHIGGTTVEFCHVSGTLSSTTEMSVGGLVGAMAINSTRPVVRASSAAVTITSSGTNSNVGGLVGYAAPASTIENSLANSTFSVSNTSYQGNLIGCIHGGADATNQVTVNNCYALNTSGNLVGDKDDQQMSLTNLYAPTANSGCSDATGKFSAVAAYHYNDYISNNTVTISSTTKPFVDWLNDNVGANFKWIRPKGSTVINEGYPVIVRTNNSTATTVAAVTGSDKLLHYGTSADMITKFSGNSSANIYVYGSGDLGNAAPTSAFLFIDEDASVTQNGNAASNATIFNAAVGITIDNSANSGNDGRDWHTFATPLKDVTLGITYTDPSTEYGFDAAPATINGQMSFSGGYFPTDFGLNDNKTEFDLYDYSEPHYHWINLKRNPVSHFHEDLVNGTHANILYDDNNGKFKSGGGYLIALGKNVDTKKKTYLSARGTLQNGDVTVTVTNKGNHLNGYNFLGNPYQSYLDFHAFANYNVEGVVSNADSLWSGAGAMCYKSYLIYDADEPGFVEYLVDKNSVGFSQGAERKTNQLLHPHQGFFVVKNSTTDNNEATVTFTNDMRITDTTDMGSVTYRSLPTYPLVNLICTDNEGKREVSVIEFNRPSMAGALKMKEMLNSKGNMYIRWEGEDFSSMFLDHTPEYLPVWFKTNTVEPTVFTLTWSTANDNFGYLHLVDNLTGNDIDMLATDSYTFQSKKSDSKARFRLVLSALGIEEETTEHDSNFAFISGSELIVTGEGELSFIDLNGRVLATEYVSGQQSHIVLPKVAVGMYMLRLTNSDGVKVQKIVVRK